MNMIDVCVDYTYTWSQENPFCVLSQIANFLLTILYGRNEVPLPQTLEMKFLRLPRPTKSPRVELAVEKHIWTGSPGAVGPRCARAEDESDVPRESRDACLESGPGINRRQSRREVTLEPDTSAVQQLLANGGGLLVDSNMRRLSMVLGWITADEGRDLEKTKKALERYISVERVCLHRGLWSGVTKAVVTRFTGVESL